MSTCVRSATKSRTRRPSSNPRQPDTISPLTRMETEDITPVAAEAFEVIEESTPC
jgi:hypothetical protein